MPALVFGGRSPIALALCEQLATSGQDVYLVTRSIDDELQSAAQAAGCLRVLECNLRLERHVIDFIGAFERDIGAVTRLAFMQRYRGPVDPLAEYQVDVLSPYAIIRSLAEARRDAPCAVVLATSPAARATLADQEFAYHASKAAISALVRFAAARYAEKGMRVNAVSPGNFVFKERAAGFYAANPSVVAMAETAVPMRRMATVSEIAHVAAFLLSDESTYVSGQILEVDGAISSLEIGSMAKLMWQESLRWHGENPGGTTNDHQVQVPRDDKS